MLKQTGLARKAVVTIAAPAYPYARGIPVVLTIAAPAYPYARGIPVVLTIKSRHEGTEKTNAFVGFT